MHRHPVAWSFVIAVGLLLLEILFFAEPHSQLKHNELWAAGLVTSARTAADGIVFRDGLTLRTGQVRVIYGYQFGAVDSPSGWALKARPVRYGTDGITSYYRDPSDAIHYSPDEFPATENSPVRRY